MCTAYKIRKWRPKQRTLAARGGALALSPGHSQILSRSRGEKSGEGARPGTNTTSRTGNGGLDSYVMWTRFHNDGNMPTKYAASTASDPTVKFVLGVLPTATDFASIKSLTKDV